MNRLKIFSTIQYQIFSSFCIIILIIWSGLLFLLYNSYKKSILNETENTARNMIYMLSLLSVPAILSDDYLLLQHFTDNIVSRKEVKLAQIIRENNDDITSHELDEEYLNELDIDREKLLSLEEEEIYRNHMSYEGEPVIDFGLPVDDITPQRVSVRIIYSLRDTYRIINSYRNTLITIGLLAIFIAFIFSYFVAKKITEPIKAVADAFEGFGMGERDIYLEIKSNNETRLLGDAFNKMVEDFRILEKEKIKDERLKTLKRISGDMARAMRNPIYSLYSVLQMFQSTPQDPRVTKKAVEIYNKEIDNLKDLTLYFDYLTKDRDAVIEKMNINVIIDELINEINKTKNIHHVLIEKRFGLIPDIEISKGEISLTIEKLIINSLESVNGNGEIKVSTKVKKDEDSKEVVITISDDGGGINPELESRIFEPFFTTKENCLGLGLNIARVIIDFYNGTIEFNNKRTGGTSFHVRLPIL